MKPRYVFVVGLPRTGTKLVQRVLRGSPHVQYKSCGETFFLGHFISPGIRSEIKKIGDMSKDANVHKLVDYMYSSKPDGGFWERLKNGRLGITKEMLVQEILNSNRSDKDIYQIVLRIHTTVTDNTILGDKTPAHLYHVPTLVEWFPEAKIIHTFRDPRAILASEWRKTMERVPVNFYPVKPGNPLYSFMIVLHVTVTWLYAARLHHKYEKLYPQNYYLSKFEDLISEPEKNVKALCDFLEIEFDRQMLQPHKAGSSHARKGGSGFDEQTLSRWQNHLKPWMKTWLLLWGRKRLKEFGYIR